MSARILFGFLVSLLLLTPSLAQSAAKHSRPYDQQYNSALPSIRPGNSDVATAHRSDGATNRPHGTLKRAPPSRISLVVSRARTAGALTAGRATRQCRR